MPADKAGRMLVAFGGGVTPAGMLLAPILRTIGPWTAGYVLLSLSLALIWIALVTISHIYQSRRALHPIRRFAPRPARLAHGFHRWQRENDEFASGLARLERTLSASGTDPSETSGFTAESGPQFRAES